jgi:hypothetical protein
MPLYQAYFANPACKQALRRASMQPCGFMFF